jgi:hypothetical protein
MGVEAHGDVKLTEFLIAEATFDWVKGELADTNEPLPRIPPFRVLAGLRFQRNGFQFGGSVRSGPNSANSPLFTAYEPP